LGVCDVVLIKLSIATFSKAGYEDVDPKVEVQYGEGSVICENDLQIKVTVKKRNAMYFIIKTFY